MIHLELAPLSSRLRAELRSRARRLKPILSLGRSGVTEALVGQVRRLLAQHELIKVRVGADRNEAADAAEALALLTPCHLVARSGFTAVLYSPSEASAEQPTPDEDA